MTKAAKETKLPALPCDENEWFKHLMPHAQKEIRKVQKNYYDCLVDYYKAGEVGATDPIEKKSYKVKEESVILALKKLVSLCDGYYGMNTLDADIAVLQQSAKREARESIERKTSIGELHQNIPVPTRSHLDRLSSRRPPPHFLNP